MKGTAKFKHNMNQKVVLRAPVTGKVIALEDVQDEMFSKKLLGEGIAFQYTTDTIYAPADGEIAVIASTKHAIGMKLDNGAELLLHVGLDTVNLKGKGFTILVEKGQKVKTGDPLMKLDREFLDGQSLDLTTPMVVTNSSVTVCDFVAPGQEVTAKVTEIGTIAMQEIQEPLDASKGGKYGEMVKEIITNVGGKDNVISVDHCITRLRFALKDEGKANTPAMEKTDGVIQVINTGGQYQVVVGTAVDDIYDSLMKVGKFPAVSDNKPETSDQSGQPGPSKTKKGGIFSRFLVMMSSIFMPVLSLLAASGMIKALLTCATLLGWLDTTSGTYIILYALGDGLLYFFPVAVGWSSAQYFGIKPIYGIVLGCCLMYPTLLDLSSQDPLYTLFAGTAFEANVYTEFLGIPVILPGAGYSGSVIPIILIVYFASVLVKFFNKKLPSVLRSFFTPFLTLLITFPLALIIIGPVAMLLQSLLSEFFNWLINLNIGVAGFVIGSLWSILVMFGLHMPIIMMFNVNIATYGYDLINPLIYAGALASMGAVLGVIIRDHSSKERSICIPAFISSFFGINEPALYGVLIPRKKTMIATFLAAGVGGMIAGLAGAKLYNFGASGPLGLPSFISPNGIDGGFIGLCIGGVAAFVIALVCSLIFGTKKDAKESQIHFKLD